MTLPFRSVSLFRSRFVRIQLIVRRVILYSSLASSPYLPYEVQTRRPRSNFGRASFYQLITDLVVDIFCQRNLLVLEWFALHNRSMNYEYLDNYDTS